ncbi:MAG TPA: metallophosphoesterase [Terracidiphilus sp.]|nr:metallophosphoesterase [Terracidiphilus sp.]
MNHCVRWSSAAVCAALFYCMASAAAPALMDAQTSRKTVSALLISDVHFEPFWDPDKVPQLNSAPVSEWKNILSSAASADQAQKFADMQQKCHARGEDTPYPLLASSLKAIRAHSGGIGFATVSGDLIAHYFDCKYGYVFPNYAKSDYTAFVEKTTSFVVSELESIHPKAPVFIALGNNDSGCGDYQLDESSPYFAAIGKGITDAVPAALRKDALASFSKGGYYSVPLPSPVQRTRLLVLDDIFMADGYTNCAGTSDPAGAADELKWLGDQLNEARAKREHVWVMAHVPTGVDPYGTLHGTCGNPTMFQGSEELADALTGASDVVRVVLFAHTHMDEIKVLTAQNATSSSGGASRRAAGNEGLNAVAVKVLPSISPVNGNNPTFTLAEIDPATAEIVDYRVYAASDATPAGTWAREYDYRSSYGQPSFSAASVAQLIADFAKDSSASSKASQNYIQHYEAGKKTPYIASQWPEYVCTMAQDSASGFAKCACPSGP